MPDDTSTAVVSLEVGVAQSRAQHRPRDKTKGSLAGKLRKCTWSDDALIGMLG